jgi:hypothetical protein
MLPIVLRLPNHAQTVPIKAVRLFSVVVLTSKSPATTIRVSFPYTSLAFS